MAKPHNIDTDLLEYYIEKSGLKITYICKALGITEMSFKRKRNNQTEFKVSEMYILCDILKIPEKDRQKIFFP